MSGKRKETKVKNKHQIIHRKPSRKLIRTATDLLNKINSERGLIDIKPMDRIGPILRAVKKSIRDTGFSSDQAELAVLTAFENLARSELSQFLQDDKGYLAYLIECALKQPTRTYKRRSVKD